MSEDGRPLVFSDARRRINHRVLGAFARRLRDEVARGQSFHCLITGDARLRRLNRDFRGKDHVTDVLSFPAAKSSPFVPADDGSILGEIAISAPRAAAQARMLGHSLETEISILMLHGVLHLLGMDHESDHGRMARAEHRWRARLGLPCGLLERTLG
jgi:probable rRNA maturation factor